MPDFLVIAQAALQLLRLPWRQIDVIGISGDPLPEILDQEDLLGGAEVIEAVFTRSSLSHVMASYAICYRIGGTEAILLIK